jgi:hypothetical protein
VEVVACSSKVAWEDHTMMTGKPAELQQTPVTQRSHARRQLVNNSHHGEGKTKRKEPYDILLFHLLLMSCCFIFIQGIIV